MAKSTGATTDGIEQYARRLKNVESIARKLTAASPLKSAAIGSGGLRVYDEGDIVVEGPDENVILRVSEGRGFVIFAPTDRVGLEEDPTIWSNVDTLSLAGPRRTTSTASSAYGGSNLLLRATAGHLTAGAGGATPSSVMVQDNGTVYMSNNGGTVRVNPDGTTYMSNANGAARISPGGTIQLTGPNGVMWLNANGSWDIGDPSAAFITGGAAGTMNLHGASVTVNTSLSVTGSKNFLMEHPEKQGTLIRYGSTESPVSAIECRGRVTIGEDSTAPITLPDHFTAIVKPDTDVDVHLSAYGPDPAWCDVPTTTGTTVHGTPGTVVAWHARAERIGGDFPVEEAGTIPTPTAPAESEGTPWQAPSQ